MFRSLAMAIGVTLGILGLECMVVEKFVLAEEPSATAADTMAQLGDEAAGSREYEPPEWMPWSLMSAGAVIIIYCFTIPRRVSG